MSDETTLKPCPGDHVLATKYPDGDPMDHFAVGFYAGVTDHDEPRHLVNDGAGRLMRANGFRRAERITADEGRAILNSPIGDTPGPSLWLHLARMRGEELAHDDPARYTRADANAEVERLRDWKDSAAKIEAEWDAQAVGKLLNIPLGQSIRSGIQPAVEKLLARIAELEAELVEQWEETLIYSGSIMPEGDKHAGWVCSNAMSGANHAGQSLCKAGLYEQHPDSKGRINWYRRRESTARATAEQG